MLCTAPPVIKHCCSPAAPQCVPHRPLTLQSSHTFHSPMFTLVHTAPHAPSLETPYLPSITHLYHIPCTHHSTTFATHPHYIFTSHPTTSPNHVHTPTPSSHLVSQHVHSPHAQAQIHNQTPSPQRCTLMDTSTHVHPGPGHTARSHSSCAPSTRLLSSKTVRTVPAFAHDYILST